MPRLGDRIEHPSLLHPRGEAAAVAQVEQELATIFGDSGTRVFTEFAKKYQVTLVDAIRRPRAFQTALYYLLGELGSNLVMTRINERILRVVQFPGLGPFA